MKRSLSVICLLFLSCISFIGIESCRNCKPIKRNLNDYSKTWITYAGIQLPFWNQDSAIAIYKYSQSTSDFITSDFRGEECGDLDDLETISFNLTSSTLSYKFNFSLSANGVGAPYNSLYTIGWNNFALLGIYIYEDTANIAVGYEELLDQIDLNGISFFNVYHSLLDSTSTSEVTDIYLTQSLGIVGFKTKYGDTWSLQ